MLSTASGLYKIAHALFVYFFSFELCRQPNTIHNSQQTCHSIRLQANCQTNRRIIHPHFTDTMVFLEPPSGTLPPLFSLCFTHGTLRTALEPVPCPATLVMLIPILVPELAPLGSIKISPLIEPGGEAKSTHYKGGDRVGTQLM
jgi:hypothetical protein